MNLFSKRFRGQGREALVAVCEAYGKLLATSCFSRARNKSSAFLFANLFFAPTLCKEEVAKAVMLINRSFVYKDLLADFSFDEVGAKEKSIKKKSAANGGAPPLHPASF